MTMRALSSLLLCAAFTGSAALAQNQALQLTTGIDGGVDFAYVPEFLPPTGITVEAVVTYDDATIPTGLNYWPTIARQNINANAESWNLRVSAGSTAARALQFSVRTSNNGFYSATYNFTAGEFLNPTHLAGTFDGQTIRIVKNGAQVATFTVPSVLPLRNTGGILRVGNGDPVVPGNESWNGTIDELRVWPMARTAAELLAAKDQELAGLPGVLAFHWNGSYDELDHQLVGAPFGTTTFVAGAPLTVLAPLALPLGSATTNCTRVPTLALGSAPTLGNAAFSLYCTNGPLPASSPLAVVVAALASAPPNQPPFFGVDLAFDLNSVAAQTVLVPATTLLGNARFGLGLPTDPSFSGVSLLFQFAFYDTACGPQGYTASNGLLFSIL